MAKKFLDELFGHDPDDEPEGEESPDHESPISPEILPPLPADIPPDALERAKQVHSELIAQGRKIFRPGGLTKVLSWLRKRGELERLAKARVFYEDCARILETFHRQLDTAASLENFEIKKRIERLELEEKLAELEQRKRMREGYKPPPFDDFGPRDER